MRPATVVQVLQQLFYVLLRVLFYLWSLLKIAAAFMCWCRFSGISQLLAFSDVGNFVGVRVCWVGRRQWRGVVNLVVLRLFDGSISDDGWRRRHGSPIFASRWRAVVGRVAVRREQKWPATLARSTDVVRRRSWSPSTACNPAVVDVPRRGGQRRSDGGGRHWRHRAVVSRGMPLRPPVYTTTTTTTNFIRQKYKQQYVGK